MRKNRIIASLIVVLSLLCLIPTVAFATGQGSEKSVSVQTNGAITFEATDDSTKQSTEEPVPSSEPATSTNEPVVEKPQGKYPSTGEVVKQSLVYGGAAVIALALILFLWKRRKKEDDSIEGGMH